MPDSIKGQPKTDWNDVLKVKGVDRLTNDLNAKISLKYAHVDVIKDDSKLVKSLDYQVGIEPPHHSNSKDISRDTNAMERQSGNQMLDREIEI